MEIAKLWLAEWQSRHCWPAVLEIHSLELVRDLPNRVLGKALHGEVSNRKLSKDSG